MKKRILGTLLLVSFTMAFLSCAKEENIKAITEAETEESVDGLEAFAKNAQKAESVAAEYKKSDEFFDYTKEGTVLVDLKKDTATSSDDGVIVEDGTITISKAGIYELTGTYYGTVRIDVNEEDERVYLVLNGATIEAKDGPAIYEEHCDKLIIMLPEGTKNSLKDSKDYSDTSDSAPTGTLFAKDNLTINGNGFLSVIGQHNDAIVSKDNIKIMSGNFDITSVDDGIVARDFLAIRDGAFNIVTEDDAIKSTNDNLDKDKGNALIEGGMFTIQAKGDGLGIKNRLQIDNADITLCVENNGLRAEKKITVNSGKIEITKSYEGIEAEEIEINGGSVSLKASDDGINASSEKGSKNTPCITVNGGNLCIDANGDGIDSNGDIVINGGYSFISATTANDNNATDYQGSFTMNGGCIVACGSSGMYQSISEGSICFALDRVSNSFIPEGTECSIYDGDKLLYSFTLLKKASAILVSSPDLENGREYTLKHGDDVETITAGGGQLGGLFGPGGFGGPMGPDFKGTGNPPPDGMKFPGEPGEQPGK